MPRYFIDTDDGDTLSLDEEGEEFDNLRHARDVAIASLPALADEKLPDGENRIFRAIVSDETRVTQYVATLTYRGEWKVPPPDDDV